MGAVSSIVFAKRNIDKTANGDIGRAPVPVVQALSATAGVAELAKTAGFTEVSKGVNTVFSKADTLLGKAGITENVCKGAGKAVNPLLCVASGIRVLRDEDKGSALVEEGLAMGSMFAGEKAFKLARNGLAKSIQNSQALALSADLNSCKAIAKNLNKSNILGAMKTVSNGKYGKWVKVGATVLADLAFVTASIFCFDMGKKLGKKITGRDKKEQVSAVADTKKQPEQKADIKQFGQTVKA